MSRRARFRMTVDVDVLLGDTSRETVAEMLYKGMEATVRAISTPGPGQVEAAFISGADICEVVIDPWTGEEEAQP